MKSIAVLVSGYGSNLEFVLEAIQSGKLNAKVSMVLADRYGTRALKIAQHHAIPTYVIDYNALQSNEGGAKRRELEDRIHSLVMKQDVLLCLGWMRIFSSEFLSKLKCPALNLHPALPGELPGMNAIKRAWAKHQKGILKKSGVMIHHMTSELDRGEIVCLRRINLSHYESLQEFEKAMKVLEHECTLDALQQMCHD